LIFIEKSVVTRADLSPGLNLSPGIDSATSVNPSSQMMPVCVAVPGYSAQILLFVMMGIVSSMFSAKKIANNK
jgi:hypothetical protein